MKRTKIGLVVAAIAVAALALPGSASASAHAKPVAVKPVAVKHALFVPDFTASHLHTMCKMTIGLE